MSRANRLPSKARLMTIMLPTMRTMKTLDAPGLLLLLPLGQRRIDDEGTKPLAARSVMKSSEKGETTEKTTKRSNDEGTTPVAARIVMKGLAKDSTTKTTTKSTMSMTTLAKNAGAAADGDGCTKTTTVCAARTDYPRRPG